MGVRPPADGDTDPDAIEFGIAALSPKLAQADVDFPIESDALARRAGHLEIPYDAAGHSMTLEAALGQTTMRRFEDEQELLNALHPVFERKRAATGNSLLSQFRALLPF